MSFPRKAAVVRAVVVLFAVAFLIAPALPTHAQDRTEEGASIRFINASPDAPSLDVIADGETLAKGLDFGAVSDFLPLTSGKHQVQLVPSGSTSESALIDEELDLDGGSAYIFAATGLLNDIKSKQYEVNLDDLDTGKARVRLINLSPDLGNVDLAVTGGDEWQDDVDFPNASDYKDVDAGTYDLDIRVHDAATPSVSLSQVNVAAGRAYDIVLIGSAASSSLSALTLETRVSPACGSVLGVADDTQSCVRFTNASPDSSGVDIYVNDTLVVQGLAFGASSDFTAIPSGDDSSVKIVAAGGAIDSPLVDDKVDLDEGQAYELLAVNNSDDLELQTTEVNLDPAPAGQARIRVIGAAVDMPDVSVSITDGPQLVDGVGFKDVSDDAVLDASTYNLQVKDGDNVVARIDNFTVAASTFYELIVVNGSGQGALEVIALEAPTASVEGTGATPAATPEAGTPAMVGTATPDVVGTPSQ